MTQQGAARFVHLRKDGPVRIDNRRQTTSHPYAAGFRGVEASDTRSTCTRRIQTSIAHYDDAVCSSFLEPIVSFRGSSPQLIPLLRPHSGSGAHDLLQLNMIPPPQEAPSARSVSMETPFLVISLAPIHLIVAH
jgi:hypothetical protein